jgi:putative membrane protein insertion efficiency factor
MTGALRAVSRIPGRAVLALLLGLLWFYRNAISPMRGPTCRYYPSCSTYAVGALRVHGPAKGTLLAVTRVCRCHPWADGGLDPVPPKGAWRATPESIEDNGPVRSVDEAEQLAHTVVTGGLTSSTHPASESSL